MLPRYARMTKQVEALIASAYLAGTNTRRVKRALAALFKGAVSKDIVSRVWRKVKTDWETWTRRNLAGEDMVRLILDGDSVKPTYCIGFLGGTTCCRLTRSQQCQPGYHGSTSAGDRDLDRSEELVRLEAIARSRTEPACRVERARILLAYRADPSTYAVGEAIGVTHQTVQRCLDRAVRFGVMAALDDSPRPGKPPEITEMRRRGWCRWPARKPRSWDIRTSFGPRGCWRAMSVSMLQRHGHPCLNASCKARSARSSPATR